MIVTQGKLLGIGLKKHAKMRKGNSSLGYFDLNGKTIIPYNLKHYLRLTTKISPSLIQITPKKVPNVAPILIITQAQIMAFLAKLLAELINQYQTEHCKLISQRG